MMTDGRMMVVQCWDDGVSTDVRLAEILRRHGARATFNLNAGLYEDERKAVWKYRDTEVMRLGWNEMKAVYDGFTIANHSLTHPSLAKISIEEARRNVSEGRDRLQQFFGQPVSGFAYPNGSYNEAVMNVIRECGHIYARTTVNVECPFPPDDPMAFHPNCHFLAPDFWSRYEKCRQSEVFYFWGHSYELTSETMWEDFERMIERISTDPGSCWGNLEELFQDDSRKKHTIVSPRSDGSKSEIKKGKESL